MKPFDYIRLAFKNLARQKSRTFLTVIAITVGSLSVIIMISLLVSVRQSLTDSFQAMGAFNLVTVVQDPNSVDNSSLIGGGNNGGDSSLKKIDDTTLASIKNIPEVENATPTINVGAKTIRLEGTEKKNWANITAFTPSTNVFEMPLLAGRKLSDTDLDKIVVGAGFMKDAGFGGKAQELIGKKAILTLNGGNFPDWGTPPSQDLFNGQKNDSTTRPADLEISAEIVGVADNGSMDDKQNYISMAWAKRLNTSVRWQMDETGYKQCQEDYQAKQQTLKMQQISSGNKDFNPNNQDPCSSYRTMVLVKEDGFTQSGYGSIIAKVKDTKKVGDVATQINKMGFGAVTGEAMLKKIDDAMRIVGLVLGLIGGISLFVAAIGIINTMVMATYERIREIGVMRACGATKRAIRNLFSFEAALLGFWGGFFGIVISFIIGKIANLVAEKNATALGNIPIDHIGQFPWWLIGSVILFTTIIGLLSGMGPAIKASKLKPVDALRYD